MNKIRQLLTIKKIVLTSLITLSLLILILISGYFYVENYVFPNINTYKNQIETEINNSLKLDINLSELHAEWSHLSPLIKINKIILSDEHEEKITLNNTEIKLSILELIRGKIGVSKIKSNIDQISVDRDNDLIKVNNINITKMLDSDNSSDTLDYTKFNIEIQKIISNNYIDDKKKTIELINNRLILKNDGKKHRVSLDSEQADKVLKINTSWNEDIDSNILNSTNRLSIEADNYDIKTLVDQLNIPEDIGGFGNIKIDLYKNKKEINGSITIDLKNFVIKGTHINKQIKLDKIETELTLKYLEEEDLTINIHDLSYIKVNGGKLENTTALIDFDMKNKRIVGNIEHIEIEDYSDLIEHLDLQNFKTINEANPLTGGELNKISFSYEYSDNENKKYRIVSDIKEVNLKIANKHILKNITGKINIDENIGILNLNSTKLYAYSDEYLYYKEFNNIATNGEINWDNKSFTNITLKNVTIKDGNSEVIINSNWHSDNEGKCKIANNGCLKLNLRTNKWDTNKLKRIIPNIYTKDVAEAIYNTLTNGTINNLILDINGNINELPYTTNKSQDDNLDLSFDIHNGTVNYSNDINKATNIEGRYLQQNNKITLKINSGLQNGYQVKNSKVILYNIEKDQPNLTLKIQGFGKTKYLQNILNSQLLRSSTPTFIHQLKNIGGESTLSVDSEIKLYSKENHNNNISLNMHNNSLKYGEFDIKDLNGTIEIKNNVSIKELTGKVNNNNLSAKTDENGTTHISGNINTSNLPDKLKQKVSKYIVGNIKVTSKTNDFKKYKTELDLKQTKILLPIPANKNSGDDFQVTIDSIDNDADLTFKSIKYLNGYLKIKKAKLNNGELVFGGDYNKHKLEDNQITIKSSSDVVLEDWLKIGNKNDDSTNFTESEIKIEMPKLNFSASYLTNPKILIKPEGNNFYLLINSDQIVGKAILDTKKNLLKGDFEKILINNDNFTRSNKKENIYLPDINIISKKTILGKIDIGEVKIEATNKNINNEKVWETSSLSVKGKEFQLNGGMKWNSGINKNESTFTFELNIKNVGEFLDRMNYNNLMKKGKAKLVGNIDWPGSPTDMIISKLNGNLRIESEDGEFVKMNPGAGKLLGLLSLQSLPKRFMFNFKDIFSYGLYYEEIDGDFTITKGLMKTKNLELDTSAAKVLISGDVDLSKKTQDLKMTVKPNMTNAASIGVAIINPIAGAATYLASKILKDPVGYVFSSVYRITGTWDEPELDKKEDLKEEIKTK